MVHKTDPRKRELVETTLTEAIDYYLTALALEGEKSRDDCVVSQEAHVLCGIHARRRGASQGIRTLHRRGASICKISNGTQDQVRQSCLSSSICSSL